MHKTVSVNDRKNSCHYYLNIRLSDGENLDDEVASRMPHSSYEYLDVTNTIGKYPLDVLILIANSNGENLEKIFGVSELKNWKL
jgi:hypothetical protein|tara:strand:+ start:1921 stop:2172 length:252 start_codon:yes stop_codon:yes gene_type:complete